MPGGQWVPNPGYKGASMSESREVSVLGSEVERGVLTIALAEPWDLTLDLGERRYSASGLDLFDSLTSLRGALEADGLLICIEGARADVYPSGMSGLRSRRSSARSTPPPRCQPQKRPSSSSLTSGERCVQR
jgi:hypothetical protein